VVVGVVLGGGDVSHGVEVHGDHLGVVVVDGGFQRCY
jgi:hypothetical protein